MFNVKAAFDACGLSSSYHAGEADAELFIVTSGKVKIKVDKRPVDGEIREGNKVDAWIVPADAQGDDDDDDIPFG